MQSKRTILSVIHSLCRNLARYGAIALLVLALPVAGFAQETTSNIRGKIIDPSGSPVANAMISVEDTRSGTVRTVTSGSDGTFLATRLLPGGPYMVTVNETKTIEVPLISVGDTYNLTVNLQESAEIEEIVTIGQTADFVEVAAGPAATFNLADLENAVSFSRDISDVYGIDPRLMIDNDEDGFGVNCAGKHPRFNNVTLDGVSQTDRFGLNENGYSTAVGMPFPYDAIEQIAVELAPFDVTYGGFSACNINSVTKSGSNDWEAKVFYEYSNNDFRGDTIANDTRDFSRASYDKTYIGFNFGGPIIQDKLFIFAAYEESDEPRFLKRGYDGSGNGEERDWLSQADYNRIDTIAQNTYNYDPGGQPGDGTQESEKYMFRLDWNINDSHNAALIYNFFDGFQARDSDGDDDEFEFANHFYTKGAESETITLRMTSQSTDAFSTELFWSTSEMNDSQVTVGDREFADNQISIGGNTVYVGADDSRQSNKLDTQSDYFKIAANYFVGNHILTAGYDRETLDIFNLFVQHSRGGEYDYFDDSGNNDPACDALTAQERFDDVGGLGCELSGIDRFELGRPSRIYYGSGGGTNDPNDAAASFSNSLNALYIQDEIFFDNNDLTLVLGLRYEFFESSDSPRFNQAFTDANGIPNNTNIDGIDLVMPRIGVTWGVRDDLTLRGGVGLYSGGNPNVWISNAWSNDGLTNAQFRENNFGGGFTVLPGFADSEPLTGAGRPGYDVPQIMVDDVLAVTEADANDSFLVAIDPNYEQPSEWKFALGGTWDIGAMGGMTLDFDYLHTRGNDPAFYQDLSQTVIGTTSAGQPIYDYTNGTDNYLLTNSGEEPISNVFSLVLRKEFDFGLDVLLGYAWTEAEDVSPMTSSVAGSNFDNTALHDINNPLATDSNYVVPNRFTMRLDYEKAFFGDNLTRFTIFGYFNEGQPQSYVMNGGDLEGDGFFGRHLLYIPDGPSDPNVIYAASWDAAEQADFDAWVAANGLGPGFTTRNAYNTGWSTRFDFRVSQEISLPGDFIGRLYFKVYNLGNMLNDDWGEIVDAQFFSPEIVNVDVDGTTGQYIFNSFSDRSIERTYVNRSLWEARLGIDVKFGH